MIINKKRAKRLGVYFFYDEDGIVDRYVDYFLKEYVKCHEKLIIVVNGILTQPGRKVFEEYTSHIIVRENVGLDVWAYKTAFEYVGWEELGTFDEITIANHTSMGPVYPFGEMYDDMAKRNLDFWGINKHFQYDTDIFGNIPYGYIPEHIQSYYMVFRKSLVTSQMFQQFWDNMPMIESYKDSISRFEVVFTKMFADKGFLWDVYVNVDDYKGVTLHPMITYPLEMIRDKRCPIFKRRLFFQDYNVVLDSTMGQEAKKIYDYLKETKLYNTDLIWDNILRTCHQEDIMKCMHLDYILPIHLEDEKIYYQRFHTRKIALFMHLYFMDELEQSYLYAEAIPDFFDVYITTSSEEKKNVIEQVFSSLKCNHLEIRVVGNRGRDVSALQVGLRDVIPKYDIICFYHDKKAGQISPGSIGESFGYKCAKNVLFNRAFVYQIINTFYDNPRLGILSPPPPNHGDYFFTLGNEWCLNYDITKELADRLGVHVPMSEKKSPIAPLGSVFWCRTKALKKLNDFPWKFEDFPEEPLPVNHTISHAIERVRPFVSQDAGFYPAYVMAEPMAEIELTNLRQYLQNYSETLQLMGLYGGTQRQIIQKMKEEAGLEIHENMPWYMVLNEKCKKIMPQSMYCALLQAKRNIFGPHI